MSQQVHEASSLPGNHAAAASGNGSSGSTAPQAPVTEAAQLSPTQQAIRAILKTGPLKHRHLQELSSLEAESAAVVDDRKTGRLCCFDKENKAWTANRVCARCMLLNKVLLANGNESQIMKDLLESAFDHTTCENQEELTSEAHTLPQELLDFVVEHAIADMKKTKDSRLIRALLHVSRHLRSKVAHAFTPIRFVKVPASFSRDRKGLCTPRELDQFIWDAIYLHFLADCFGSSGSTNRQQTAVPAGSRAWMEVPAVDEWLEALTTVDNSKSSKNAYFRVELTSKVGGSRFNADGAQQIGSDATRTRSFVSVRDAREAIQSSIVKALDESEQPTRWVNFANPFLRALEGDFDAFEAQVTIEVSCWLRRAATVDGAPPKSDDASKHWKFETRKAARY